VTADVVLACIALTGGYARSDGPAPPAPPTVVFRLQKPPSALAVSPDDSLLVVGAGDGGVHVVDLGTGKELRSLAGHRTSIGCVAFLGGDAEWLMSFSADRLRVWNPKTAFLRKEFAKTAEGEGTQPPAWVAASPASHAVAFVRRFGSATVWEADKTMHPLGETSMLDSCCLAWSPDGFRIAEIGASPVGGGFGVYDARTGKAVWERPGAAGTMVPSDDADFSRFAWIACRFTPNGGRLLRLANDKFGDDGHVRANDAATGAPQWTCDLKGDRVIDLVLRADGVALLLTAAGPRDLDTQTGEQSTAADLPKTVACAAYAPKSRALFLGLSDGTVVRAPRAK
jgi:WD40 repeat protein